LNWHDLKLVRSLREAPAAKVGLIESSRARQAFRGEGVAGQQICPRHIISLSDAVLTNPTLIWVKVENSLSAYSSL
jgi:hypothetical protein